MFLTARDPFYFKEVVQYYVPDADNKTTCAAPKIDDIEYEVLTDHANIFPLGYPTEQYLAWVKNDVHKAMQEMRQNKKKTILAMKRDLFNGTDKTAQQGLNLDRERGLI